MKSLNTFGWLAEVMIPRADRCAGFFLYDVGNVKTMSSGGKHNEFTMLAETDADLRERLLAPKQLRESGVQGWEDTSWDKAGDMLMDSNRGLYMLLRIPKPEDPTKELERELSRCASAMLLRSNEYSGTSNNIMNNYSGPALLLCVPSNLAAISRYAALCALGFKVDGMTYTDRYSNAQNIEMPTPPVDGFAIQDWFVMQEADLPLSYYGRVHNSSYGASALEIPWVIRAMFAMLRNKTYYVLLSSGSGMRNMIISVLLPASPEMETLDGMASLVDRVILTKYAGGTESFSYGNKYEHMCSGMRVCVSGQRTMTVDTLMAMLFRFNQRNYYNVQSVDFESEAWCSADDSVMSVLRESKEPGGAAWYGRRQAG